MNNNTEEKIYNDINLHIIYLALQRYSLLTKEFYKLTNLSQIFTNNDIINSAYVALDLWSVEKFQNLEQDKHIRAKRILYFLTCQMPMGVN